MWVNPQLHLHWFVHRSSAVKKKITDLLKNCVASLFTFFKKVFTDCEFYILVFRCKVLGPFISIFICCNSIQSIGIFFFAGRKCFDLVITSNKERQETFAIYLQNRKSCVCIKHLALVQPLKLIAVKFTFLYSM